MYLLCGLVFGFLNIRLYRLLVEDSRHGDWERVCRGEYIFAYALGVIFWPILGLVGTAIYFGDFCGYIYNQPKVKTKCEGISSWLGTPVKKEKNDE